MAGVSATRNSSQSRNQLLAAMSAADFASLQPHLKPVAYGTSQGYGTTQSTD